MPPVPTIATRMGPDGTATSRLSRTSSKVSKVFSAIRLYLRHTRRGQAPGTVSVLPGGRSRRRVPLDELVGDRVEIFPDVVRLRADVERGVAFAEDERGLPAGRAGPAQRTGDLGVGRHGGEPVGELGGVGLTDGEIAGGGEHLQDGGADVGERD